MPLVQSSVVAYQRGTLQIIKRAENGSGLYLELNPKLYILKSSPIVTETY